MASNHKKIPLLKLLIISLISGLLLSSGGGIKSASAGITTTVLADFESGILPDGFVAFSDFWDGSGSSTTISTPVVEYPVSSGNLALQVIYDVAASGSWGGGPGYAGITHDLTATQDWSSDEGFSFWFAGANTGNDLRVELKSDGTDPAYSNRYEFTFTDDSTDWELISIPWSSFSRRNDYNPGPSPDDPINLSAMWGYSILIPGGAAGSFFADEFGIYKNIVNELLIDDFESGLPTGADGDGISIGFVTFQDPNSSAVISTTGTPPAPVPNTPPPNNVLQLDVDVLEWAGFVHNFENETVDTWVPQDWSAYEGISFWLYGNNSGTTLFVDVLDNRNPDSSTDDAERWSISFIDDFSGWQEIKIPFADMTRKEIGNGAPNDGFGLTEVHGWAFGTLNTGGAKTYYMDNVKLYGMAPEKPLTVGFSMVNYEVTEGETANITVKLSKTTEKPVVVHFETGIALAVPDRDYIPVDGTLTFQPGDTTKSFQVETIDDMKYQGELRVLLTLSEPVGDSGATLSPPYVASLTILDNESYDRLLLDDFETYPYLWDVDKKVDFANLEIAAADALALPGQGDFEHVLEASQKNGKGSYQFSRAFPIGQDWSASGGLNFWYYGRGNDEDVVVSLTNDQAEATDPAKWKLVWSDEFDMAAGEAADTSVWGQEVGDGTINGIPGWGNDELQYYTPGSTNAATDGMGNLQITAQEADDSLMCYYGPCEYTSARLLTKDRFEIAYGRLEARIKVPEGAGLWPAFWMLGTDIDEVDWPQSGEIDIMEYVGREPYQIFGTLHGPGYSGGMSYGQLITMDYPIADDFHTYAIEWQPDQITWFYDGEPYFTATPDDPYLADKQWVFNHPFFILLNVAVGGNFGGAVGEDTTFPQSMLVDYVRLYQTKEKPISFKASFTEDFSGWQKINLPFEAFTNDDGYILDTTAVESLGFKIPGGSGMPVMLDQIRLSCPSEITVTNSADSGSGSLRGALDAVCAGGTILFSPDLDSQTITLLSGPLTLSKNVTIDAAAAPGLTISGGGTDRVFIVDPGTTATLKHLTVADGFGWQLAGGILNNGSVTLDHVSVLNNTMATDGGDFWQGGGGIYNGEFATLNLIDSTVANNLAGWSGGGIYSFFNTTTTILRSTISGNTSNDVGGGIRSLGTMTITNSTISGNTATGWHGGAIFMTDGDISITNSTIANNIAPDWASSTIFIGQYGGPSPTLTLNNTIITGNQWYACEKFASGTTGNVVSMGSNLIQDDSCNPVPNDQITSDALIDSLADNGGPTLTHALLPGSPAIDTADDASCPATDQRGVSRPQGAHCDIGAYEAE